MKSLFRAKNSTKKREGAWRFKNGKRRQTLHTVAEKLRFCMLCVTSYFLFAPVSVYATADGTAEWNQVMDEILKWVPRIGGVLLFLGAIEFAIANKNEDANAKTQSVRLMISGGMVIAIPTAIGSLIKI